MILSKAGALLLEPHPQSILLWLFWRWCLRKFLSWLVLNLDLPDLSFPSSWDYRCEPVTFWNFLRVLSVLTKFWNFGFGIKGVHWENRPRDVTWLLKGTWGLKSEIGPKLRPRGPVRFSLQFTEIHLLSSHTSRDLLTLVCWLIGKHSLSLSTPTFLQWNLP
jgi:hypothetical protein